jgi:hypothetical protein
MDDDFSSQPDLTNQPISHLDIEYFAGGSCFIQDSTCFAGYATVTLDLVNEVYPLLVGTSAQKTELVALTWVLQLAAEVQTNTYTTLNMSSLPFMSMGPSISRGVSLIREEKVSSMGRKSSNC